MKKLLILTLTSCAFAYTLNSCNSCVKKSSELVGEAAETSVDAVGTVAEGAGRSVDRQLDENTETVFGTAGRTIVQSVSGTLKGVENELNRTDKIEADYTDLSYTTEGLPAGLSVSQVRQHRNNTIEAYTSIPQGSTYNIMLDGVDASGNVIIALDQELTRGTNDRKTISAVNFKLGREDLLVINKVVKYNVTAKQLKFKEPVVE